MKILRISLHNLASLAGTHTVDFTVEPLRSAGLFAICGPTGAGKSTLLDALCLALYDKTPRLAQSTVKGKMPTGEQQSDPRNLMRRGTALAWAEVAFVGVDQKTYTARWKAWRGRHKVEEKLQAVEMCLWEGNQVTSLEPAKNPISTQKTETLAAIREKVGLSFEQFTRAVLLAQNDFAAFLKASESDRAEILQALTDTAQFSEISKAIQQRCSEGNAAIKLLEAQAQGLVPLTETERAEAQAEQASAAEAHAQAQQQLAAAQKGVRWFDQRVLLLAKQEQAQAQLSQALAEGEAATPRKRELQLTELSHLQAKPLYEAKRTATQSLQLAQAERERAQQALSAAQLKQKQTQQQLLDAQQKEAAAQQQMQEATPALREARRLDAQLQPLLDTELQLKQAAQAAETEWQAQQQREAAETEQLKQTTQRLAVLRKQLSVHELWAAMLTEVNVWGERLNLAEQQSRQVVEQGARVQAVVKSRELTQQAYERCAERLPGEEAALLQEREKLVGLRSAIAQLDVTMLTEKRDRISEEVTKLEKARQAEHRWQQCKMRLTEETESYAQSCKRREQLRHELPIAETRVLTLEQLLQAVADEVKALRARLVENSPCPVCGALDHPYSDHAPEADAVAQQVQKKELQRAVFQRDALRAEAATLDGTLAALERRQTQLQQELAGYATELLPDYDADRILSALSLQQAELHRLRGLLAEHLQLTEKAQLQQTLLEKKESVLNTLRLEQERLRGEQLSARQAESDALQLQQQKQQDYEAALRVIQPLRMLAPELNLSELRAELRQRHADLTRLQTEQDELQAIIIQTESTLVHLRASLSQLQQRHTAALKTHHAAESACAELRLQRAGLLAGRSAEEVEHGLQQVMKQAQKALQEAGSQQSSANAQLQHAEQTQIEAEAKVVLLAKQEQSSEEILMQWLSEQKMGLPQLMERLARTGDWIHAEREVLAAVERAIATAEGNVAAQQREVLSHEAERPEDMDEAKAALLLDEAQQQLEATQMKVDETRARLLADDQCRHSNAALLDALMQARAAHAPYAALNDLLGSSDGTKFRVIAQRCTLDYLLEQANEQLRLLAPRYRLESMPKSLGLLMVDEDMGGEKRSVASLSGGETFLVSLALALGLAGLTSHRLKVESLFIDEGFGSLDADTLGIAMNALMQLEAQGRKVGVISHVPEMSDAIPVQIRVKRKRGGESQILIMGSQPLSVSVQS